MSEELKIFTKYSNNDKKMSRYLWVFSNDEDELSFNHPDVLDWQSGLENLEQFHTQPIEKKPISKEPGIKKDLPCSCKNVPETIIKSIELIKNTLENIPDNPIVELLDKFLNDKKLSYLEDAIKLSESGDILSFYRISKIAQKLKDV